VSRRQRIPISDRTAECAQSPIIQSDEAAHEPKRPFVAANPSPDSPPEIRQLRADEVAALRAFFELLSQWDDELTEGETEHE
jgi:hypothetical protein